MTKPIVEKINEIDFVLRFKEEHGESFEYRRKVNNTDVLHREDGPAVHLVCDCGKINHYEYRQDGHLHRLDGPAVPAHGKCCSSPEQTPIFSFWGINVPEDWTKPGGLTLQQILNNSNPDVRAVGIRAYGTEKFVHEATETVIEIDQGLTLTRALVQTRDNTRWLVCTDGSTKSVYVLRVPENTKNCREAYAALTNNVLKDEDKIAEG